MTAPVRRILRQIFWYTAALIGGIALALQAIHWSGQIVLPHGYIGWSIGVGLALGYAGQKVGQERPPVVTVRSDKELEGVKADLRAIVELLQGSPATTSGGNVRAMPNPRVYQLGIEEGLRRARGGDDRP